ACLLCSDVQLPTDSEKNGCPNCEEIISFCSRDLKHPIFMPRSVKRMKGSMDSISVCTTTYFDGIISLIDPVLSWFADGFFFFGVESKMYAITVKGRVPEDVDLKSRCIKHRLNNHTDQDYFAVMHTPRSFLASSSPLRSD
ncbi:hypothetical protein BKA82DRAFT_3982812, partial [Pisolithus tinctorius]